MLIEILHPACEHASYAELSLAIARDESALLAEIASIQAQGARKLYCLPCWQAEKIALAHRAMPDLPPLLEGSIAQISWAMGIRPSIILACQEYAASLQGEYRAMAERALPALLACQDANFFLMPAIRRNPLRALELIRPIDA